MLLPTHLRSLMTFGAANAPKAAGKTRSQGRFLKNPSASSSPSPLLSVMLFLSVLLLPMTSLPLLAAAVEATVAPTDCVDVVDGDDDAGGGVFAVAAGGGDEPAEIGAAAETAVPMLVVADGEREDDDEERLPGEYSFLRVSKKLVGERLTAVMFPLLWS